MTLSLVAVAALANGLLIGLIPTLVDGLKPAIQARLNLPEERIEWHVRLFYLAWLPGMPLAGWLLDAAANRDVLLYAGLLPLILGMAWLGLARNSASAFFNAIFLGLGYSVLTTATVRLMTVAFFPDFVNDFRLNIASLNLGFVAIGLGAILGPYLVKAVEQWTGVRQGLLYISIAMLAPAVLTALCESSAFPSNVQEPDLAIGVFTNTIMGMIAVVILLYFALETCLEFWPEAYLKEIGYEGRAFNIGVLVFWLAFVASRLAAAWLFYEHPSLGPPLTLILLIASAVILGNLAGGFEIGSGSLGFWLLGVCYGPLLPGFLGIALDLGAPLPTSALGMLLALSGIDTLVLRPFLAGATRNYKPRSVMFVPTIMALLATAVLLVLGFV